MGKTYKDQRKYDNKRRERDTDDTPRGKRVPRRQKREQFIPLDDEPLDKYDELNDEWGEE
jgi:hypothetical protein